MSAIDEPDEDEFPLHSYTVDDPRLWEPRPHLDWDEFTIPGLTDEEWDEFHRIIAEA